MTVERDEEQLDQLLQSARGAVRVPETLSARVLADAAMVKPRCAPHRRSRA